MNYCNVFIYIVAGVVINKLYAQEDRDLKLPQSLPSVIVTAYKEKPISESSLSISNLNVDSLAQSGVFNLSELMAKLPGVNQLSTGPAISKPVIRGLYGNRVLILLSGLKFDNQQWQEEHGLGLSEMGLEKLELIKGPMSVLYGTEAIGGVIHLVEEKQPASGNKESEILQSFNSNTLGLSLQAGYKYSKKDHWWRFLLGAEDHADYADGNGNRVLNSRFDGYNLKTSFGFHRKNWISVTHYLNSFNRFGFIFNDIYTFIKPDSRWSRDLSHNPSHQVFLNILSSENKFILKNESILNFNIGFQSNLRMEKEGGGKISLKMHLLTFQYLLKWENQISSKTKIIFSNLGSFESNKNYGSRKIVPDAKMQESNISVYFETRLNDHWIFENGAGIGEKYIHTSFTATINNPGKEISPFNKFSPYYNLYSGFSCRPTDQTYFKFNAATGVRVGNLAELSSDGLHEGIFTYEIGNPDLKNEQIYALNLITGFTKKSIEFTFSPFYNYFNNYIYLIATGEDWFGFPVFRYKQQDAKQYGLELNLKLKTGEEIQTVFSYSGMISKTLDGNYTPYQPAQKLSGGVNYSILKKENKNLELSCSYDHYFAQSRVALNEIATPAYGLMNVGAFMEIQLNNQSAIISLNCNNLFDKAYYDHLSRFKNFGLLNIGRNIAISIKYKYRGIKK